MGTRMGLVVLSVKTGIISGSLEKCETSGRQIVFAVVVEASAKIIKAIHPGDRTFSIIRERQL